MNNSPFSMGWLMAMFDLPVMTDKERKVASRFRNDLLDHGFLMIQFSVYARPCVNFEQLDKHTGIIKALVPEAGNVRLLYLTCYGRPATTAELLRAFDFLTRFEAAYTKAPNPRLSAWQSLCKSLIAANEFLYVD